MEDDEEGDIEETVVLVDLNGIPNPGLVQQLMSTKCCILGIDSDTPIIQVGNYIFKGQYKDIMGTALLFDKDSNSTAGQKNDRYKLIAKAQKRLVTERVNLKQKLQQQQDNNSLSEGEDSLPEGEHPLLEGESPMETHEGVLSLSEGENPMETEN